MFRFFRFLLIALISLSVIGCDDNKMGQDIISDVMVDANGSADITGNTEVEDTIAICNIGDILMPGQSCSDPNSDATFSVLTDGTGLYISLSGIFFESIDLLDTQGASLNDITYSFRASKLDDGTWQILSNRSQLAWPLILSAIGDPVGNEILTPVNDASEWINNSPAPGIWERPNGSELSNYSFPKGSDSHLGRYVGWMGGGDWKTNPKLGHAYPHWFYSHAESTMIWDISGYDVIRFEGGYLLPEYRSADTEADDGNVEIMWYADDVLVYASGKTSYEKTKDHNTDPDLSGHNLYTRIVNMNFDIPRGTDELKLHVSNSDDGVIYDHFVILNPKLYTTEPNNEGIN